MARSNGVDRVGWDQVGGAVVVTVRSRRHYETRIAGGPNDGDRIHYKSEEAALAGHVVVVETLQQAAAACGVLPRRRPRR